jgi:hypothetical protein
MGLRFYEKYLFLFGVAIGLFLLSGTYLYFSSDIFLRKNLHRRQLTREEIAEESQNVIRDLPRRQQEEEEDTLKRIQPSGKAALLQNLTLNGAEEQQQSEHDNEYRRNFVKQVYLLY